MTLDLIKLSKKVPQPLRLQTLGAALDVAIPFNFGLGMQIKKLTPREVVLESPDCRRRRNHVNSAHACFLALLSEYPAGLLIAQKYSFEKYRLIIAELKMEYFKQGRGRLKSTVQAPKAWPRMTDGESYINLKTEIKNEKGEQISLCQTRWQVKEWTKVRKK